MYLYLYSYRRETARQLRMYAQLTRCFSAVAELLVFTLSGPKKRVMCYYCKKPGRVMVSFWFVFYS